MLEINKQKYEELIADKKYIDAGTLLLISLVGSALDDQLTAGAKKVLLTAVCYNEMVYALRGLSEEDIFNVVFDEKMDFLQKHASLVLTKIKLTLNDLETPTDKGISYADPRSLIADSILNLYKKVNTPDAKFNPQESLIPDLFDKIINQGLGIVRMLNLGLNSESFGSWRTFHESIAITKILIEGGAKLRDAYLKHIVYSNAFRGGIEDEAEKDRVFEIMKSEMKNYDLKSKDMKKFIEYGWLYEFEKFDRTNPSYKLNFRDGIQRCAGLSDYSEWYEAASELSHGSAIFFYSNDKYFQDLTLHGFYDMLIVLSEMISSVYKEKFLLLPETERVALGELQKEVLKMKDEQMFYFDHKYFGDEDGDNSEE